MTFNRKSFTIAVVESVTVLIFNLVVAAWWFSEGGSPLTPKQQFIQYTYSFSMVFLRIAWFYIVIQFGDWMMAFQEDLITLWKNHD